MPRTTNGIISNESSEKHISQNCLDRNQKSKATLKQEAIQNLNSLRIVLEDMRVTRSKAKEALLKNDLKTKAPKKAPSNLKKSQKFKKKSSNLKVTSFVDSSTTSGSEISETFLLHKFNDKKNGQNGQMNNKLSKKKGLGGSYSLEKSLEDLDDKAELNLSLSQAVIISDSDDDFQKSKLLITNSKMKPKGRSRYNKPDTYINRKGILCTQTSEKSKRRRELTNDMQITVRERKNKKKNKGKLMNKMEKSDKEEEKENMISKSTERNENKSKSITQELMVTPKVEKCLTTESQKEVEKVSDYREESPTTQLNAFLKFHNRINSRSNNEWSQSELQMQCEIKQEMIDETMSLSCTSENYFLNVNGLKFNVEDELPEVNNVDSLESVEKNLIELGEELEKGMGDFNDVSNCNELASTPLRNDSQEVDDQGKNQKLAKCVKRLDFEEQVETGNEVKKKKTREVPEKKRKRRKRERERADTEDSTNGEEEKKKRKRKNKARINGSVETHNGNNHSRKSQKLPVIKTSMPELKICNSNSKSLNNYQKSQVQPSLPDIGSPLHHTNNSHISKIVSNLEDQRNLPKETPGIKNKLKTSKNVHRSKEQASLLNVESVQKVVKHSHSNIHNSLNGCFPNAVTPVKNPCNNVSTTSKACVNSTGRSLPKIIEDRIVNDLVIFSCNEKSKEPLEEALIKDQNVTRRKKFSQKQFFSAQEHYHEEPLIEDKVNKLLGENETRLLANSKACNTHFDTRRIEKETCDSIGYELEKLLEDFENQKSPNAETYVPDSNHIAKSDCILNFLDNESALENFFSQDNDIGFSTKQEPKPSTVQKEEVPIYALTMDNLKKHTIIQELHSELENESCVNKQSFSGCKRKQKVNDSKFPKVPKLHLIVGKNSEIKHKFSNDNSESSKHGTNSRATIIATKTPNVNIRENILGNMKFGLIETPSEKKNVNTEEKGIDYQKDIDKQKKDVEVQEKEKILEEQEIDEKEKTSSPNQSSSNLSDSDLQSSGSDSDIIKTEKLKNEKDKQLNEEKKKEEYMGNMSDDDAISLYAENLSDVESMGSPEFNKIKVQPEKPPKAVPQPSPKPQEKSTIAPLKRKHKPITFNSPIKAKPPIRIKKQANLKMPPPKTRIPSTTVSQTQIPPFVQVQNFPPPKIPNFPPPQVPNFPPPQVQSYPPPRIPSHFPPFTQNHHSNVPPPNLPSSQISMHPLPPSAPPPPPIPPPPSLPHKLSKPHPPIQQVTTENSIQMPQIFNCSSKSYTALPNQPTIDSFVDDYDLFMQQDFNEVFGYTNFNVPVFNQFDNFNQNQPSNCTNVVNTCNNVQNEVSGQLPANIQNVNTATNLDYKIPSYKNQYVSLQTIINNTKEEVPSFSPSKILKPQSDVKKRLGIAVIDSEVYGKLCFSYMKFGKCAKHNCTYKHELGEYRESLHTFSKELIFTVIQRAIRNKYFFYIKSLYLKLIDVLDYCDAINLLRMLNVEVTSPKIDISHDVAAIVQLMLKKPNVNLSSLASDLFTCTNDSATKTTFFKTIQNKVKPGQFWDTFRSFFRDNIPSQSCLEDIIQECVAYRKNRTHLRDVCLYLYHLKYDRNLNITIGGAYFDTYIEMIKKENLHEYLKVFGIVNIVPTIVSPNKCDKGVIDKEQKEMMDRKEIVSIEEEVDKVLESDQNLTFGIPYVDLEQIMREEGIFTDDIQDKFDDKIVDNILASQQQTQMEDNGYRIVEIDIPEPHSRYHDWFGSLNEDLFQLEFSLKTHEYLNALKILKKYSIDCKKNSYNSACFHRCYYTIKNYGQTIVNKGSHFKHANEFWLFIKDLYNLKESLITNNTSRVQEIFKRYSECVSVEKRNWFTNVCYLILRGEISLMDEYFMLIRQEAVHSSPRGTMLNMLFSLASRILAEFMDKGFWLHAYNLIKHIKYCLCDATLTLLMVQIYVANQRSEKAYYLLKRTMILFQSRERWLVPSTEKDEELRVSVIHIVFQSLISENVEVAFCLFELLLIDQINIWNPIDLTRHVNYLALVLIHNNHTEMLIKFSYSIMKYNILLQVSMFRLLVVHVTRIDIDLGKKIFHYAVNCGVYNILKRETVGLRSNTIIMRMDSTEEEIYLIMSDLLIQLLLNCGQGTKWISNQTFRVYIIFQDIPTTEKLYKNVTRNPIDVLQNPQYQIVKKKLEHVLSTRFYPPINIIILNQYQDRHAKIQPKSLVKYLKYQASH